MIYAGILAAGIGARMHRQDMPKQFLHLGEKPIIINTLEQFLINPYVDKIIIVVPESWKIFTEDLIDKYDNMGKSITVIAGGENKTVSVQMIVRHIENTWGIDDSDILLAHDGVRPFVTQRIINENIEIAKEYGAVSTVMTTNDTIFVSADKNTISEIPSKSNMFAAQTPQTFKLKTLRSVFEQAITQGICLSAETELARLCIRMGTAIRLVQGEYFNMKIINPYDLEVANALLRERET
jgi:2-C-methyl-D-erythritol 4-phosphate cytidylyltransferase